MYTIRQIVIKNARPFFTTIQHVNISRSSQHKPEELFQIISGTQYYKEFLPFIQRITVMTLLQRPNSPLISSKLKVKIGLESLQDEYICDVVCKECETIQVIAHSSKYFKSLKAVWTLRERGKGSQVTLDLVIDFKSAIYAQLGGIVAQRAGDQIIKRFEERANVIYGSAVSS